MAAVTVLVGEAPAEIPRLEGLMVELRGTDQLMVHDPGPHPAFELRASAVALRLRAIERSLAEQVAIGRPKP